MKNLIKIICLTFVIILECQCLLANGYKKDRVAIVGNSLASNFAYYNNIEGENIYHNAWVTKHAVGGDELESYGLPYSMETYTEFGTLPQGFGKGFISSIVDEAKNYDYIIIFIGSNYVQAEKKKIQSEEARENRLREFFIKYKAFVEAIRKNNQKCKIILMEIPNGKISTGGRVNEERLRQWNKQIKKVADDYIKTEQVFMESMSEMSFANMDILHFDRESNKKLWERIVKKYGIRLTDIIDPNTPVEHKKQGRMNQ